YRERLKGAWGERDVADCVNAAKYLVQQKLVDESRLIIKGSSAGGLTTLAALIFYDYFKAGASYYGVADLEGIAKESHKFESRYLESLVGPY
ncbi:prolyl oligopeptidase family serine peptidase, partial [bacterium LRH843]|nr:prolyl oligopeptidase family serine peptidase [bacterium LRH843]